MIKAILFDLDNVLVEASEWHYEALNKALRTVAGFEISREDHEKTFNGLSTKQKLEMLLRNGQILGNQIGQIERRKQIYTKLAIIYNSYKDQDKIVMLETLRRMDGLKIACVTNCVPSTAKMMLKKTGLYPLIDYLVTNKDVKEPKPSPEGYLKAVNHFGLKPRECLIVEDSEKGLKAAFASDCYNMQVFNSTEVTYPRIIKLIREING